MMTRAAAGTGSRRRRIRSAAIVACVAGLSGPVVAVVAGSPDASATGGSSSSIFILAGTEGTYGSVEPTLPALATSVQFESPTGVAVDSAGNVYVADQNNCVVWKVVGASASIFAGTLGSCSASGDGGAATSAKLFHPQGLAVDPVSGNLLIGTATGCTVREVAATTGTFLGISMTAGDIYTVAGKSTCGHTEPSLPAAATTVELSSPSSVSVDSAGDLFVADSGNCAVWEVDATGSAQVFAGTVGSCGQSGAGGPATSAKIGQVAGVAVGQSTAQVGDLFIADPSNCAVWEVSSGDINAFAGLPGLCGSYGDGGAATSAEIGFVTGVATDAAGDVFMVMNDRCTVREVSGSGGIINTIIGIDLVCAYGSGGGDPSQATLHGPKAIAVDSGGSIYVADSNDEVVREAFLGSPSVTSLSPTHGPSGGGTSVTIDGSGFSGTEQVLFGTAGASAISVLSNTEIVAVSPVAPAGTTSYVDVTVKGLAGSSTAVSADHYQYDFTPATPVTTTTALSISPNPAAPGDTVILTATVSAGQTLPGGQVTFYEGGQALFVTQVTTGGTASYSIGNLGLGSYQFAADYSGWGSLQPSVSSPVTLSVESSPGGSGGGSSPVTISTASLANATLGSVYSEALTATGGSAPYQWTIASGLLPTGLSLSKDGTISGTPTSSGTASFVVEVADSSNPPATATATLSLDVVTGGGGPPSTTSPPTTSTSTTSPPTTSTSTTSLPGSLPSGYITVTSSGVVRAFGSILNEGSLTVKPPAPIVGWSLTRDGAGYWLVGADGSVYTFGDARFHGSTGALSLKAPVVGMAATPDGGGYWLVASDGGIFSFGDARFHGSMGGIVLNKPVVGIASTPDGAGYWEVASDGGIFTFGDARFHGSTGALALKAPIVGMAATPDGAGYWLVASDGGVFTFGDARFHGSTGAIHLAAPVTSMVATPDGAGYWLFASDGGVFTFGDARFYGSGA